MTSPGHQSRQQRAVRTVAVAVCVLVTAACGPASPQASPASVATPFATPTSATGTAPTAAARLTPTAAQGVPTSLSSEALQEVRVGMAFVPNVQFAPFYVADAKGYFAAEGIKPIYDYGFEQDVVALTAEDKLTFTNAGASAVIAARGRGLPIRYFIEEYQSMPIAIFAPKESGIATIQDLKGRSVGQPGSFGDTYTGYKIMLDKAGLATSDVHEVKIGFTQIAALLRHRVDAAVGYSVNEPLQLRAQGREVVQFDLKDYAPEVAGNGIIASEKTLREQPELARAFARAFLKGLEDTISSPREAFEISVKFVPDAGKDAATSDAQFQVLKLVVDDYLTTSEPLGHSDVKLWERTQSIMKATGLIERETDMHEAVTNYYLPW